MTIAGGTSTPEEAGAAGEAAGVVATAGVIVILEAVDDRLKTAADLKRVTGLPVLATLGDLILTATGDLSRNRRVGLALARGEKLSEVVHGLGHVAEGVNTAPALFALAQRVGVEVPILSWEMWPAVLVHV